MGWCYQYCGSEIVLFKLSIEVHILVFIVFTFFFLYFSSILWRFPNPYKALESLGTPSLKVSQLEYHHHL